MDLIGRYRSLYRDPVEISRLIMRSTWNSSMEEDMKSDMATRAYMFICFIIRRKLLLAFL